MALIFGTALAFCIRERRRFSALLIAALRQTRSRSAEVKSNPTNFHSPRSLTGLRVLAIALCVVASGALAGCASNSSAANTASWSAVGNNGGKADRYAIARAASADTTAQVASASIAANQRQ
jgi:hypothetical protein